MKMGDFAAKVQKNKILIKLVVALLLLLYIFTGIDFSAISSVIANVNLHILSVGFLLAIFNQMIISNLKWSLILKAYNTTISFKRLCEMYLTGMFFSMFLPGAYGGDFVRAYQVSKHTENRVEGIMSVVFERVSGLMGLLFVLLLSLLVINHHIVTLRFRIWGVVSIALFFLLFFLLFFKGVVYKINLLSIIIGKKREGITKDIHDSIDAIKKREVLLATVFLSILFQILVVLTNYLIANSIDVDVPFSYLMLIIPVISLLSMIPVTLNGIGIRDISYIGFLGAAGVGKEAAFSIGLLAFFMGVIMSLCGGIIYMSKR